MKDQSVINIASAQRFADLQEKEALIQQMNWFLQLLGSGMTVGMIRVRVYNRLVEIKGEGVKA